ncbi:MAG TPA: ABC transporter substrate-binding protein [Stellaceae bacterium]|jgi:NitT/TauT family transport system substrate-binding protein|nr:ABC transporter substrate-binding protein [Stellaceae bacterium]
MRRVLYILALLMLIAPRVSADEIRIGTIKVAGAGALFIAEERGYFAAEGLTPKFVFFESAQPIAVANVSGDIDYGVTPPGGGFYALAGQGALKIIGGYIMDWPSFQANGAVVSLAAYEKGFRSFQDMGGKTLSTTQIGGAPHYAWALIAEHFGIDFKTVHIVALQSNPNQLTAAIGGQVDAAMMPSTVFTAALQEGKVKLLGFAGDITPWQLGAVFTSAKIANNEDQVRRFLRAYVRGAQDYHDAFTNKDERREDQATAPAVLDLIAKAIGQTPAQVRTAVPYMDRQARVDVGDVLHQIAWFKSQGMLKDNVDGATIIDKRYVVPMPKK